MSEVKVTHYEVGFSDGRRFVLTGDLAEEQVKILDAACILAGIHGVRAVASPLLKAAYDAFNAPPVIATDGTGESPHD